MLQIDHVVYAVQDLEEAGRRFEDEYGLGSVPGGVHPEFGTGNRIVPLGPNYIELMAVVDRPVATANPLGRYVAASTVEGDRLIAWCVATDNVAGLASRLGLAAVPGHRSKPDGTEVSWRAIGLERAIEQPSLPFFVRWNDPAGHPGLDPASHSVLPTGIAWIEVGGDETALKDWLGGAALPVRIAPDAFGVRAVGVGTDGGEIVIR